MKSRLPRKRGVAGVPPRLEPNTEIAIPRPSIAPYAAVQTPEARSFLRSCGVRVHDAEREALTSLRAKLEPILRRVPRGKHGRTAWDSVSWCGRVVPQASADSARLVHASCGLHKVCPRCAREKSREDAGALRKWVDSLPDDMVLVATVTQVRKSRRRESCSVAIDRLVESFSALRRGTKPKREPDRDKHPQRWARFWWRTCFVGGHRSVEVTYSQRGEKSKDGTAARFSGFHAHAHMVLEMAKPPKWWVEREFPGITADDEGVLSEWAALCQEMVWACWRIVSPVREVQEVGPKWVGTALVRDNVHADFADRNRIYQACKYATKPAILNDAELLEQHTDDHADSKFHGMVELFRAVRLRKLQSSWGSWIGWRKKVDETTQETQEIEEPKKWLPLRADLAMLLVAAKTGHKIRPVDSRIPLVFDAHDLLKRIAARLKQPNTDKPSTEIQKRRNKNDGYQSRNHFGSARLRPGSQNNRDRRKSNNGFNRDHASMEEKRRDRVDRGDNMAPGRLLGRKSTCDGGSGPKRKICCGVGPHRHEEVRNQRSGARCGRDHRRQSEHTEQRETTNGSGYISQRTHTTGQT